VVVLLLFVYWMRDCRSFEASSASRCSRGNPDRRNVRSLQGAGRGSVVYLLLSTVLGHSLHPVAAHFIHEHYTFAPGRDVLVLWAAQLR